MKNSTRLLIGSIVFMIFSAYSYCRNLLIVSYFFLLIDMILFCSSLIVEELEKLNSKPETKRILSEMDQNVADYLESKDKNVSK